MPTPFASTLKPASGGGGGISNDWLYSVGGGTQAIEEATNTALVTGAATISNGSPGFELDVDNVQWHCTETGLYVILAELFFLWTPVALGAPFYIGCAISPTSEATSLANFAALQWACLIESSLTVNGVPAPFTTPPLAFTDGDEFTVYGDGPASIPAGSAPLMAGDICVAKVG
jgi:hypothetical protein